MRYLTCFLLLFTTPAFADELVWHFTNGSPYKAQIDFRSTTNPSRWWPGNGEAFTLNDRDEHTYRLRCSTGEEICYGAVTTPAGKYFWGRGGAHNRSCRACCAVCGGGDAQPVNLTVD